MPIRPGDFDTSSRRTAVPHEATAADRSLIARRERAKEERVLSSSVGPTKRRKVWIAGGASLLIVCLVAAAILLVSPKPAAMRITPPIATDPVSDAGKYDKHSDDFGVVPPPGNPQISPPPAPRPKTQKNPGVRIKESPGQERAE